ncbi:MAG: hypothetical protein ACKVQQ_05150 [Burkholderiales bacterium]
MLGSPPKRNKLFDLIHRISFADGGLALSAKLAVPAILATLALVLPSTLAAQNPGSLVAAQPMPASMANIEIAPRATALTFARHRRDDGLRLILIERFAENHVEGIDLSASLPGAPTGWARSATASPREETHRVR